MFDRDENVHRSDCSSPAHAVLVPLTPLQFPLTLVPSRCSGRALVPCLYLHQLRFVEKLRANRPIVLVRPASLRIGPGKPPADCWIVGPGVDGADVFPEEDAAPAADPGAPLAPSGP